MFLSILFFVSADLLFTPPFLDSVVHFVGEVVEKEWGQYDQKFVNAINISLLGLVVCIFLCILLSRGGDW